MTKVVRLINVELAEYNLAKARRELDGEDVKPWDEGYIRGLEQARNWLMTVVEDECKKGG